MKYFLDHPRRRLFCASLIAYWLVLDTSPIPSPGVISPTCTWRSPQHWRKAKRRLTRTKESQWHPRREGPWELWKPTWSNTRAHVCSKYCTIWSGSQSPASPLHEHTLQQLTITKELSKYLHEKNGEWIRCLLSAPEPLVLLAQGAVERRLELSKEDLYWLATASRWFHRSLKEMPLAMEF